MWVSCFSRIYADKIKNRATIKKKLGNVRDKEAQPFVDDGDANSQSICQNLRGEGGTRASGAAGAAAWITCISGGITITGWSVGSCGIGGVGGIIQMFRWAEVGEGEQSGTGCVGGVICRSGVGCWCGSRGVAGGRSRGGTGGWAGSWGAGGAVDDILLVGQVEDEATAEEQEE